MPVGSFHFCYFALLTLYTVSVYTYMQGKQLAKERTMNSDRMIKMVNAQIAPTNEQMRRWGMSVDEIEQQRREEAELDAKYDAIYDAEQAKIDAVAAKWAVVIGKSARETRSMMERFAGSIGTPCGEWKSIPASRFSSPAAYDNFCAMMTEYDNLF